MNLDSGPFIGILGAIIGFLATEIYSWAKSKISKDSDRRDKEMNENTEAVKELSLSLVRLEIEIKHLSEKLSSLPKIEKDVNEAHAKIREIKVLLKEEGGGCGN